MESMEEPVKDALIPVQYTVTVCLLYCPYVWFSVGRGVAAFVTACLRRGISVRRDARAFFLGPRGMQHAGPPPLNLMKILQK